MRSRFESLVLGSIAATAFAGAVALFTDETPARAQAIGGLGVVALGYCQLTSIDASTLVSSCSGGIPAGANRALIKAEAQAVRWRDDGTAPTATVGIPMAVTDAPLLYAGPLSALRVISQTAGGKLDVAFYKSP